MPKGKILIIGGAEDKGSGSSPGIASKNKQFEHFEILQELLPTAKGKKRIEVISTASDLPAEMNKTYRAAFKKAGFTDIGFMKIEEKKEAKQAILCERIRNSHAVFFTGGDQFKLSGILGGTECIDVIKKKYNSDPNFIVAGTSAGAMAMSKIMIYEGGVNEALLKDDLKMSSGLGVFDTCIIDTHFIKRGRFGRLAHAIVMNPEALGIGLGEDTALIIKNGTEAECKGSGMVVIIDGKEIEQTNITEADSETPIFVEKLVVHLLAKGAKFSIKDRKVLGLRKRAAKKIK